MEKEFTINSLRVGDLILIRYKYNPLSALIRFFINLGKPKDKRSRYNHVATVISINGFLFITEAAFAGTRKLISAKEYLKKKDFCVRRAIFGFQAHSFNTTATKYAYEGAKYDYKGVFVEQLIFQLTGYKKTKTKAQGDKKLYCSEYYARLINVVTNGKLFNDYYLIDPQDLYVDNDKFITIYEPNPRTNE
jgi:hypothetical protein